MSVLLSIDTSSGTSVALRVGDNFYGLGSGDLRGHTEVIGGMIADVFAEADRGEGREIPPSLVEGVVVGVGPGPFTGLRVGIAAAEAFAFGVGAPLLPVTGHEAWALAKLRDTAGTADAPPLRVLQDAKRRELFVTEYDGIDGDGLPVQIAAPHLLARADYVEEPRDSWLSFLPIEGLLHAAELRLRAGREFLPAEALYLRDPDVYPSAGPKRVIP